jgi:hypothetical protein
MNNYEALAESLGINRGKLAGGFPDEPSCAVGKNPPMRKAIGQRPGPPPPEDLTHLNPAHGTKCQAIASAWWNSLTAEQQAALAARRGKKYQGRNYAKTFRGE